MKKSRQGGLEPSLSQKVESKLLISSKQTSTLSTHLLTKLDHYRHEEHLQKEYNLKFMTDRKRNSAQKTQKSLSSSKITHKEPRSKQNPLINIQPQRLDFESMDYRTKYYELHDEYIHERRKNMERAEQALELREALGSFLIGFDSKGAEEVCRLLEGEKVREAVRRAVEGRRRAEAGEGVLKEAMRILQVDSWEELVHNLRARVERFRNMDECTFKILELEAINKRVVNDFEERLQQIKEDQEEQWDRERHLRGEELKSLQKALQSSERQRQAIRSQFQATLKDISHLASEEPIPHLLSGRSEVHDLQRLVALLRNRLQEIEVQAEENMFKLLKSNQEMLRLERSISELRGEMELQIEDLQVKNQQNLCEISHLQAQLEQQEQEIARYYQQAARKETERLRTARQEEDERALMANALTVTDSHPAKLLLAIKERQDRIDALGKECQQLRAAVQDKDRLSLELQVQVAKSGRITQQAQETTKTALFQKEQYKFLLNNLRDQFSEVKRQHQEELSRTIQRKDEEIVASNRDILESHANLTDQLANLRADHTKLTLEHEDAKASLLHYRTRSEQAERLLVEKQGVIKRLSAEGERYKTELRQLEGSFRDAVELEELNTRQIAALEAEKTENTRLIANYTQRNAELTKNNEELSREKNQFKTELSIALNDIKELKDVRAKLEALNVELRLQGLNKSSEITKLQEKLKNTQNEVRVLKAGNDKLMSEVNSVTRKLIAARTDIRRRVTPKLKDLMAEVRKVRDENEALKKLVKLQLSQSSSQVAKNFAACIIAIKEMQQINDVLERHVQIAEEGCQCSIETVDAECQNNISTEECGTECQIISSSLRGGILNRLTAVLTALSLLRSQKNEIDEALLSLQSFSLEEVFRLLEDPAVVRLRQIQGSIEMIREDSREEQESQLRDMAKIITPDEIFPIRSEAEDVNTVLLALLEEDEVPSVPYWEKIEANFLALRRRLVRRSNHLRLDISAIDFRDPSVNSPHSSTHEAQLFRRMTTDPDESQLRQEFITNRSERFGGMQSMRRENEELRMRLDEVLGRLGESQDELQELRGKLVKLQNETSIVGLQHNFKKVLDYLLNDNADLFLQTCRILMKMLHFAELDIKDFEEQLQKKRNRKKSGLFSGLFKV